ncbi:DNA polymerase [Loktanella fryxellensis]|uniref:DNA polymerase n=1 Tax=Loktanella fryxellensis TaxID=245187 RepID=A0A1H8AFV5_9RHOB|nr:uracil-DNA glycosylase [Loktanella fryxellensis]SEM69433.1 DNA polymerase [Loktanella fryxellensis]
MESDATYWADVALLDWQVALGADEAIGDVPVDRYALDPVPPKVAAPVVTAVPDAGQRRPPPPIPAAADFDAPALAAEAAAAAGDLAALRAAQEGFGLCTLKRGARSYVGAEGDSRARVMIVGDAPGRAEDQAGRPFVGPHGVLLDRMLAAIGLDRTAADPARAVHVMHVLPWRTAAAGGAGAALPEPADLAMMTPFLLRHIALVQPDVVVCMGNAPCQALLGRSGVSRMRGQWDTVLGRPLLPMYPPQMLLGHPAAKRAAWTDLLALKARLR